jgi:hypothetical protein
MKKTVTLIIFILTLAASLKAQQRSSGIKILLKDKVTGFPFMNDSMVVIFNDTIKQQFVSDIHGYAFFALVPGRYSVQLGHIGYQSQRVTGIVVGEAKTAYMTIELSNSEGEKIKKKKKKGGVKLKMVKN